MMDLETQYMTIPEAAELLRVSRAALYGAIRDNRLEYETVFGRRVLRREDVAKYQVRTASVGAEGGRPKRPRQPVGRPRKNAQPPI